MTPTNDPRETPDLCSPSPPLVLASVAILTVQQLVPLQASKKHYCVHPVASSSPNLEEECEKMLGDGACRFFLGAHQLATLHSTPLRVRDGERTRLQVHQGWLLIPRYA